MPEQFEMERQGAWGGISVLLDDAKGPEEDEDECEEGCCALQGLRSRI
jgi:hypothetical protein